MAEDKDEKRKRTDEAEESNDNGSESSDEIANNIESELNELKKQHLYLRADFENYRKQTIKERSDLIKYGAEPVIREFLNILDNLERATQIELKPETIEQYKNGVDLIKNQVKKSLERFGVEEVPSEGQPFDPAVHEALGSVNNPDLPPHSIAEVFKKAYKLHGKVIRPAQVVVNTFSGKKES